MIAPVVRAVPPRGDWSAALDEAARVIGGGGIVVHPTETLYGLAVDPWNDRAVARLLELKGRQASAGLILLVESAEAARSLTRSDAGDQWLLLAREFWPGPLTLVLPASPSAPGSALGAEGGVAVRLSSDPVARALVRASGKPLTSTSANRSGGVPAATAAEAATLFGAEVDLLLDAGPRASGIPSTIVDLSGPVVRIVREGAVSRSAIETCLSRARIAGPSGDRG